MRKTASEIVNDIKSIISDSELAKSVNGGIYGSGERPANSRMEDIIIILSKGYFGDIDSGTITLNIYVDQDPDCEMETEEDSERAREIERLAQDWVDSLDASTNYLFEQVNVIKTWPDRETHQRFVAVILSYSYYDKE